MDTNGGLRRRARTGALMSCDAAWIDPLYRVALRVTGSSQDAEELVGEAYLDASRVAPPAGEEGMRVRMFRALRCALDDRGRRDGAHAARPARSADAGGAGSAEVEHALAGLPEDIRVVVLLDLEGLSYAEIGNVLDLARDAVTSRLWRGRALLRERSRGRPIPGPGGPSSALFPDVTPITQMERIVVRTGDPIGRP